MYVVSPLFSISSFLDNMAVATLFLNIPNMQLIPQDPGCNNNPFILINRPYKFTQGWNLWSSYPSLTSYCTLAEQQRLSRSPDLGHSVWIVSAVMPTSATPNHSLHACILWGQAFVQALGKLEMQCPVQSVETLKLSQSMDWLEAGSKQPDLEEWVCLDTSHQWNTERCTTRYPPLS